MRLYLLSLILVFCVGMSMAEVDYNDYNYFGEEDDALFLGGHGGGGRPKKCGDSWCAPGYECENRHGHYICRRQSSSSGHWTSGHHTGHHTGGDKDCCGKDGVCKEGQYCAKLDGKDRCVYYPEDNGPQCGGKFCKENQICVLKDGVLRCLDNPIEDGEANCGLFHCNYLEYCIMVNGYLQCLQANGTAPFACGKETCSPPAICVTIDGCQQCVDPPKPIPNCGADLYCREDEWCRRTNKFECIPKIQTCLTKKCTAPQVCIMVNNDAQCVTLPTVNSPRTIRAVNPAVQHNVQTKPSKQEEIKQGVNTKQVNQKAQQTSNAKQTQQQSQKQSQQQQKAQQQKAQQQAQQQQAQQQKAQQQAQQQAQQKAAAQKQQQQAQAQAQQKAAAQRLQQQQQQKQTAANNAKPAANNAKPAAAAKSNKH